MRQGAVLAALALVLGLVAAGSASAATVYKVTNTNDSGGGSLRQAILDANANAGKDRIEFKIGSGSQTITPASPLPALTDPVLLDGTTQPGYAGSPLITLNGSTAGFTGLTIGGGSSTVRALVLVNWANGIRVTTQGGNTLLGNVIQSTDYGITLDAGSPNNRVGGSAAGAKNDVSGGIDGLTVVTSGNAIVGNRFHSNSGSGVMVMSGAQNTNVGPGNQLDQNQEGIEILGDGNTVHDNFIGTNATGTAASGNADGVAVDGGATGNVIRGNVISGNSVVGIDLGGHSTDGGSGTIIQGNKIGTDAAGTAAIPNAEGIRGHDGTDNTKIGGKVANPPAGNLISGNNGSGIVFDGTGITGTVIQSNLIGTNPSATAALANGSGIDLFGTDDTLIADNVISGNTGFGIGINNSASTNHVQGNLIGTDGSGSSALGNGAEGISQTSGADSVFGPGNVISANAGGGVLLGGDANNVLRGNHVGTDASGTTVLANGNYAVQVESPGQPVGGVGANDGNVIAGSDVVLDNPGIQAVPILRNSIFGGSTISITNGANHDQVAPVLNSVTTASGSTTIRGTLNDPANPSTPFRIEFFVSGACAGTHSPAEQFLIARNITTDGAGSRDFRYAIPALPGGKGITLTATNLSASETSMFSNCQLTP